MNLIEQHKKSLKLLKKGIKKIQKQINFLKANKEYTKNFYSKYYNLRTERYKLNSMKTELEYKIKWMETAREPNSRQGIDNIKAVECYK